MTIYGLLDEAKRHFALRKAGIREVRALALRPAVIAVIDESDGLTLIYFANNAIDYNMQAPAKLDRDAFIGRGHPEGCETPVGVMVPIGDLAPKQWADTLRLAREQLVGTGESCICWNDEPFLIE